jgi:hypothetical protein
MNSNSPALFIEYKLPESRGCKTILARTGFDGCRSEVSGLGRLETAQNFAALNFKKAKSLHELSCVLGK